MCEKDKAEISLILSQRRICVHEEKEGTHCFGSFTHKIGINLLCDSQHRNDSGARERNDAAEPGQKCKALEDQGFVYVILVPMGEPNP